MIRSKKSIIFLALCLVMQQTQVLHAHSQHTFLSKLKNKISQLSTAKKIGLSIASLLGASLLGATAWYFKKREIQSGRFSGSQMTHDLRGLGLFTNRPQVTDLKFDFFKNPTFINIISLDLDQDGKTKKLTVSENYSFNDGSGHFSIVHTYNNENDIPKHSFTITQEGRTIAHDDDPRVSPALRAEIFQHTCSGITFKHTDDTYYLISNDLFDGEGKAITCEGKEQTVYTAHLRNLHYTSVSEPQHAYIHFYCYDEHNPEYPCTALITQRLLDINIKKTMAYISDSTVIDTRKFQQIQQTSHANEYHRGLHDYLSRWNRVQNAKRKTVTTITNNSATSSSSSTPTEGLPYSSAEAASSETSSSSSPSLTSSSSTENLELPIEDSNGCITYELDEKGPSKHKNQKPDKLVTIKNDTKQDLFVYTGSKHIRYLRQKASTNLPLNKLNDLVVLTRGLFQKTEGYHCFDGHVIALQASPIKRICGLAQSSRTGTVYKLGELVHATLCPYLDDLKLKKASTSPGTFSYTKDQGNPLIFSSKFRSSANADLTSELDENSFIKNNTGQPMWCIDYLRKQGERIIMLSPGQSINITRPTRSCKNKKIIKPKTNKTVLISHRPVISEGNEGVQPSHISITGSPPCFNLDGIGILRQQRVYQQKTVQESTRNKASGHLTKNHT